MSWYIVDLLSQPRLPITKENKLIPFVECDYLKININNIHVYVTHNETVAVVRQSI